MYLPQGLSICAGFFNGDTKTKSQETTETTQAKNQETNKPQKPKTKLRNHISQETTETKKPRNQESYKINQNMPLQNQLCFAYYMSFYTTSVHRTSFHHIPSSHFISLNLISLHVLFISAMRSFISCRLMKLTLMLYARTTHTHCKPNGLKSCPIPKQVGEMLVTVRPEFYTHCGSGLFILQGGTGGRKETLYIAYIRCGSILQYTGFVWINLGLCIAAFVI